MAAPKSQVYLEKLDFIVERNRLFPVGDYLDSEPADWTRQMKSALTQAYNLAILANSTSDYADAKDYATMAKRIRPFAKQFSAASGYNLKDINNWTPAMKGQLTKHFKKGVELTSRQVEMYHSPNSDNMKAVGELAGQKGYKFNSVFYPSPPGFKLRYNKRTNTVKAMGPRAQFSTYEWEQFGVDPDQLARDPAGVAKQVMKALDHTRFAIRAGEGNIGKGARAIRTANQTAGRIAALVEKYNSDDYDPDDTNSSWFGNWLIGFEGWDFDSAQSEREYTKTSQAESGERRRYKRAERRQLKARLRK